jgi:histidinol phosphatase-like PHP family hydrolase
LNSHWKIKVIPGVELTHVPLEEIEPLVKYARENGAKIVIAHGETLSEPVLKGTNRRAIECGVDILAHPGNISERDAALASDKGVFLEITARKNHLTTNKHVAQISRIAGAKLVLNTDAHGAGDLVTEKIARKVLIQAGLSGPKIEDVFKNSRELIARL